MDPESGSGTLVLAATPLGDARDASARLIDALSSAPPTDLPPAGQNTAERDG